MSLNTPQLKTDLKQVYSNTLNTTGSADEALDAFLDALTDKLEKWVKTAAIQYTSGLVAGTTAVTGTFNGNLK